MKKKNKRIMENRDNNRNRNVRPKPSDNNSAPNPELEEEQEIRDDAAPNNAELQEEITELQTLSLFPTTPLDSSSSSNNNHASSSSPAVPAASDSDNKEQEPEEIIIIPPFPWATDRPSKIHTMQYLLQNNFLSIPGDVQCGSCHGTFEISYDLREKVAELRSFMKAHRSTMHSRSPKEWNYPNLLPCRLCGKEKRVKPVIGSFREHNINWLFLLLGQLIGFCTLDELRYFCDNNGIHKTAAKDRFVYYTYIKLFKQLFGGKRSS